MKANAMASMLAAVALAGCVTVEKSEYPQLVVASAPEGRDVMVKVEGFLATQTDYVAVYGYSMQYAPTDIHVGRYGRYWAPVTVATETYVPQVSQTTAFQDRAVGALEKAGFLVKAPNPTYSVEVTFAGPYTTSSDRWSEVGWSVFSLFLAERGTQTWSAKLKIRDIATGRLLLDHDYEQRYQATVLGLIPFFSTAASDDVSASVMKAWCLSALTDRAVSDAAAFLAAR